MKMYILSDGWPAYLQADGTLTDTPNPKECDLSWDNLKQIKEWDDDVRLATPQEIETYDEMLRIRGNDVMFINNQEV